MGGGVILFEYGNKKKTSLDRGVELDVGIRKSISWRDEDCLLIISMGLYTTFVALSLVACMSR